VSIPTYWKTSSHVFMLVNVSAAYQLILHSVLLFKQFQYKSASNIYSPWPLCSVNHSNICWSGSGYVGVKRPIVVHFTDIFSSPLKSLAWSLHQRQTMDSLSPYSQAISELFSTASTSATTLSLKAILYDECHAFGMMNGERLIIDFSKHLFVTIKISLVAFI